MKTLTSPLWLFILTLSLVTTGIISVYSASSSNVYKPVLAEGEKTEEVKTRPPLKAVKPADANAKGAKTAAAKPKPLPKAAASPSAFNSATMYLIKQLGFAVVGLILMLGCYCLNYHVLKKYSFWIMIAALAMCIAVWVPGLSWSNGRFAHRWIKLGPLTFQASEFAKLALVIYMAKMLSDRRQYLKSFFSGVLPAMIITGLFAAVIVVEPDFGAAFVLCVVIFGMWLVAEMRWFHLVGLCSAAIPAGVMAFLLEPYRVKRFLSFAKYLFFPKQVDKELLTTVLYQLYQSLITVGSGGMWGLGLGESRQKYHYLTEGNSDFIFAIMCEELGFVRISIVVVLYTLLILLGWLVAWRTTDLFGSLLASGITLMIFTSAAIHMCVVLGLLPTKGLVLPFLSAGGSSLMICMAAMGILMNIARNHYAHQSHGRGDED